MNLLEAIALAKLPKLSRQELEIMFGVEDLRKTRFAQELIAETKLETIPELLKEGLSQEKIAAILKLELQQVREYINNMN